MATVTKPIALDESLNTTELSSRNVADVLAQELSAVATAIGGISAPSAEDVSYDNSGSGLSAADVQEAIDELASEKVDKEVGKGLSTNDYTDTEKTKLAGIEAGAEVNPTSGIKTATESFETVDGGLLSKCQINLVPVQSGSGDPSPDNVRAISGHTEVDLYNVGKNLLENTATTVENNGGKFKVNDDGTITCSGTPTANVYIFINQFVKVSSSLGKITISGIQDCVGVVWNYVSLYDHNNVELYRHPSPDRAIITIDLSNYPTVDYISVSIKRQSNNVTMSGTVYPQIEKGTLVTSYEPYNPSNHLYTINLGGTYYGGYLDVVSGEFVATHGVLNIADMSGWFKVTDDPTYPWFTTLNGLSGIDISKRDSIICNKYKNKTPTASNHDDYCFGLISNGSQFRVRDMRYNTASDFANSLSDCVFLVPLATPQTIQLTPQQVEALVGQNNLSTPLSGQSIETNGVEYKELFTFADVKELIAEKVPDAPTTDGTYTLTATVSSGVATYSWT